MGGSTAVEKAIEKAGFKIKVPFTQGRGDATEEMTDKKSFDVLDLSMTDTEIGRKNYMPRNRKKCCSTELN